MQDKNRNECDLKFLLHAAISVKWKKKETINFTILCEFLCIRNFLEHKPRVRTFTLISRVHQRLVGSLVCLVFVVCTSFFRSVVAKVKRAN